MEAEILPRVPEIRCYICGNENIKTLCHHCGRAMCAQHHFSFAPQKRFYQRIEDNEYTYLGLEDSPDSGQASHCTDCFHFVVSYEPLFYGVGMLGLIAIVSSMLIAVFWLALAYIALGAALIIVAFWAIQEEKARCHAEMCKAAPPFPVFGRFPSITIRENISGTVSVDSNGRYLAQNVQTDCTINFSLQLVTDDQERLKRFHEKYTLPASEDAFHSGFVILRGTEKVQTSTDQPLNPLSLVGHINEQPFLVSETNRRAPRWEHQTKYHFSTDTNDTTVLPIQIIPTLLSEGREWALGLNVQVNSKIERFFMSSPIIEALVLKAPNSLQQAESLAPSASFNLDQQEEQLEITWHKVRLNNQGGAFNKQFYVRFAKSKDVKPDGLVVHGFLRLLFDGAASELEVAHLFSPLGNKFSTNETAFSQKTTVTIHFCFHLEALSVRQLYHPVTQPIEQLTAIPESEAIIRLVHALNDKDMYVQRVIENLPQMSRANAEVMNRFWVIAGRRYKKATPIDFRIVAIGQEQYEEKAEKPHDGNTRFEVTTQGTVIREGMQEDVDQLHTDIVEVIETAPSLEIVEIRPEKDLFVDRWGDLCGVIYNKGAVVAEKIEIFVKDIRARGKASIDELKPGDEVPFSLSVCPDFNGDAVPIMITAVCRDKFGQLPSHKKRHLISVFEQPKPSSNHTHFHDQVIGSVHTGSGHIRRNDEDITNK